MGVCQDIQCQFFIHKQEGIPWSVSRLRKAPSRSRKGLYAQNCSLSEPRNDPNSIKNLVMTSRGPFYWRCKKHIPMPTNRDLRNPVDFLLLISCQIPRGTLVIPNCSCNSQAPSDLKGFLAIQRIS